MMTKDSYDKWVAKLAENETITNKCEENKEFDVTALAKQALIFATYNNPGNHTCAEIKNAMRILFGDNVVNEMLKTLVVER